MTHTDSQTWTQTKAEIHRQSSRSTQPLLPMGTQHSRLLCVKPKTFCVAKRIVIYLAVATATITTLVTVTVAVA